MSKRDEAVAFVVAKMAFTDAEAQDFVDAILAAAREQAGHAPAFPPRN